MIAVRIPKEIREYKTKVWKRFTARNLERDEESFNTLFI